MTTTTALRTVTLGQGTAVHSAYYVGENITGSLCNPFAWQRSRVRLSDRPATCPRCAKATDRAAQQVALGYAVAEA